MKSQIRFFALATEMFKACLLAFFNPVEQGHRGNKNSTDPTSFHFHRSDRLQGKEAEKFAERDFMLQRHRLFRTGPGTFGAGNTEEIIMKEFPSPVFVCHFQCLGGALDIAGGTSGAYFKVDKRFDEQK